MQVIATVIQIRESRDLFNMSISQAKTSNSQGNDTIEYRNRKEDKPTITLFEFRELKYNDKQPMDWRIREAEAMVQIWGR